MGVISVDVLCEVYLGFYLEFSGSFLVLIVERVRI